MSGSPPLLSAVVAHWHGEEDLERLLDAWPEDPRFELVVVDNGSTRLDAVRRRRPGFGRWIAAGSNLGFGGAINLGARSSTGDILLILNPDATPAPGALEQLISGFARHPEAAGLAPRLESADGTSQHRWQLAPLPRRRDLVGHAFFLPSRRGNTAEPGSGTGVEQPAAAALALRRSAFERLGGFDESFRPAWFEDVDLAARLHAAGERLLYWPASVFTHRLGSSVERLGYGDFLLAYTRNLVRYGRKHHGPTFAATLRAAVVAGSLLRLAALPLRRPRRARSRAEAARALLGAAAGAITGR